MFFSALFLFLVIGSWGQPPSVHHSVVVQLVRISGEGGGMMKMTFPATEPLIAPVSFAIGGTVDHLLRAPNLK